MKDLVFSGDVDDPLVTLVYKGGWNRLVLSSEGGCIYCCRAICDYLLKEDDKQILLTGRCFSSSTAIAVAGAHCSATTGTRFMVHAPHTDSVEGTARSLENEKNELDAWLSWYLDLLECRTKLPRSDWKDLVENETYLSASAALELGLIDDLVSAKLQMMPTDSIKFWYPSFRVALIRPNNCRVLLL